MTPRSTGIADLNEPEKPSLHRICCPRRWRGLISQARMRTQIWVVYMNPRL